MPDSLNISLTGMLAFQRALQVTSHNISNANTPGYSRQVADFSARVGGGQGNTYLGGGTQVSNIRRMYDGLQVDQLRSSMTGFARFDTLNSLSSRIDTLLADADTGLNSGLQSYFNSVQDLANNPASISTRQALIGEAEGVASRFQSLDTQLGELEKEVNGRLTLAVDDINRIATSIASLNEKIALANNAATPPNDLLDARDALVLELSGQVSVSTTIQDDGTMSVFIGSGQSLVTAGNARQLTVAGSEFDLTRMEVAYQGSAGSTPLDTSSTGGALGGLLEYRSRILDPARQSLGQTAVAFAASMNEQNASGMDLRGNLGGDLFGVAPPTVLYSNQNLGSGTANASVSDLGALTGADYVLEFDGAAYSLSRADTGEVIPLSGTGTGADPLVGDGINIVVGGSPAPGDRLLVRTGQDAAASIRSVVPDAQSIAMAAPTRAAISQGNIGNATISAASLVDRNDPGLLSSSVIEFTSPTTYSINGAGSFAYTDGDPIVVNGSSVSISGTPSVGDQFTIEPNYGASGDNSNGLLMADVQSTGLLDGGTVSINESYTRLVSSVGAMTHQIQGSLDAQGVVLSNAEAAVSATSGVNLDEEAANLIKYQQAYQAVAQVVAVVSTMFDSLLAATRR
ncbi:MAG: flagellar hook-associated protein FlgK [Gammaproteobacteria bacterium]|nr:flagellar hook-associated protein FlgK [Gammaproteobacteria bacterium]